MINEIPKQKPDTPLLDTLTSPDVLRSLELSQIQQVVDELRHFLVYTVGQTGGHFGAGLGVVELTVALHYVFDTPNDQLVWDVGHQTYPTQNSDRSQGSNDDSATEGWCCAISP